MFLNLTSVQSERQGFIDALVFACSDFAGDHVGVSTGYPSGEDIRHAEHALSLLLLHGV